MLDDDDDDEIQHINIVEKRLNLLFFPRAEVGKKHFVPWTSSDTRTLSGPVS